MDDLYRENILDHFRTPRNFGKLKNPDVSWEEVNLVCGDKIGMDIHITNNKKSRLSGIHEAVRSYSSQTASGQITIKDIRFSGEGCAISMASASLLTEFVKGRSVDLVKKITPEDVKKLLGIEPTPARLKCALLPLETLHKALNLAQNEKVGYK